jgi:hypothetical protein
MSEGGKYERMEGLKKSASIKNGNAELHDVPN